jgi:hypothetical protein
MTVINSLRGPKLNGISVFDVVATAFGAFILSNVLKIHTIIIFILLIILAIGIHYALGVPTMLNYFLGINTLEEVMDRRKQSF